MKYVLVVMLAVLSFLGGYFTHQQTVPVPGIRTDTVLVYKAFADTISVPKFYAVVQIKDSLREVVRVDTVLMDSADYYNDMYESGLFLAVKDTSFADSTLTASISFVSPVPLHPKSYFYNFYKVKSRTIERTIIAPDEQRFGWGVQTGLGYGFINRKPDVYIGIGFSYRFYP